MEDANSNQHRGRDGMNVTTIDHARNVARELERRERDRIGSMDAARLSLARRAGVTPSTWRNLAMGRLKRLDAWMRDKLQQLLVRELESEITRLSHELDLARQSGTRLDSDQVSEIQAHILAARLIMGQGDSK